MTPETVPERSAGKRRKHPVFSFPKVGRTWVTFLWYHYAIAVTGHKDEAQSALATRFALMRPTKTDFFTGTVEPALDRAGRPQLHFTHIMQIGDDTATMEQRIRALRSRRNTLLVRDPVNALQSYFHHIRSLPRAFPESRQWTGVTEVIRSDRFGIDRFIDYYRLMGAFLDERQFVVHHEDLRADTAGTLRQILVHAGDADVRDDALAYAVEMTGFERLKQLERDAAQKNGVNVGDNRMRFRSGRNVASEVSDEDRAFIRERLAAADVPALRRYVGAD